jgi:hypothetical protein
MVFGHLFSIYGKSFSFNYLNQRIPIASSSVAFYSFILYLYRQPFIYYKLAFYFGQKIPQYHLDLRFFKPSYPYLVLVLEVILIDNCEVEIVSLGWYLL